MDLQTCLMGRDRAAFVGGPGNLEAARRLALRMSFLASHALPHWEILVLYTSRRISGSCSSNQIDTSGEHVLRWQAVMLREHAHVAVPRCSWDSF